MLDRLDSSTVDRTGLDRPGFRLAGLRLRAALLMLVALAIVAGLGSWGYRWWSVGRFFETTDDAYLAADNVTVMSKVTGYVAEVSAEDNRAVKAGDVLVRIDDRDYRAAVDQTEADLAQAKATIGTLDAEIAARQAARDQRKAEIDDADAAAAFAQRDWERYQELVASGAATHQRAELAATELRERQARRAGGRAALTGAEQDIAVLRAQRDSAEAAVRRCAALVEAARLNLEHTVLTAPIAGVVGDRSVRLGQLVQPGSQLLTIVPVQDLYLVANFKETQIGRMHSGDRVRIAIDAFPDLRLTGRIDSLAPGSGAQFALLPPENATGNFVKIVQRVPVKIRVDADLATLLRLRPGLSATASVDTRD